MVLPSLNPCLSRCNFHCFHSDFHEQLIHIKPPSSSPSRHRPSKQKLCLTDRNLQPSTKFRNHFPRKLLTMATFVSPGEENSTSLLNTRASTVAVAKQLDGVLLDGADTKPTASVILIGSKSIFEKLSFLVCNVLN